MVYIVKAQTYDNPHVYCTYECEDVASWLETVVTVAQTRRKGAKMRLMDAGNDFVRFDVQLTKLE